LSERRWHLRSGIPSSESVIGTQQKFIKAKPCVFFAIRLQMKTRSRSDCGLLCCRETRLVNHRAQDFVFNAP
jgi:hypothetical protein